MRTDTLKPWTIIICNIIKWVKTYEKKGNKNEKDSMQHTLQTKNELRQGKQIEKKMQHILQFSKIREKTRRIKEKMGKIIREKTRKIKETAKQPGTQTAGHKAIGHTNKMANLKRIP